MGFIIKSSDAYLPKRILLSSEIDGIRGVQEGHSELLTCLQKRHIISENETVLTMAVDCAKRALEKSNHTIEEMDCIIYASGTPIQTIPYGAASLNAGLENSNVRVMTFDVTSTCLSFVTALHLVSKLFQSSEYRRILVVTSEVASVGLDYQKNESAGIFGDGAVAYVLEHSDEKNNDVFASFQTYAPHVKDCELPAGGGLYPPSAYSDMSEYQRLALFSMDHKRLLKLVLSNFPEFWEKHVVDSGVDINKIKKIIPHQGSYNIVRLLERKLALTEGMFADTFHYNGNQIAASIPTSLHLMMEKKEVIKGDKVVLIGTSAGVSFGALNLEI